MDKAVTISAEFSEENILSKTLPVYVRMHIEDQFFIDAPRCSDGMNSFTDRLPTPFIGSTKNEL